MLIKKQFFVNGHEFYTTSNITLFDLINYFNYTKSLFVLEYNNLICDKSQWKKITIANNYLIPTISSQVLFEPGNVIIDDNALEYIIENYTYIGFKGLMIAGVIAMSMSTADSHINSSVFYLLTIFVAL